MAAEKAASAICCSTRRSTARNSTRRRRELADAAGPFQHYLRRICGAPRRSAAPRFISIRSGTCAGTRRSPRRLPRRLAVRAAPLPVQRHADRIRSAGGILRGAITWRATRTSPRRWRRASRRNGYEHFLANGVAELRAPHAVDRPALLRDRASRRAQRSASSGRTRDAFAHYLTIGREQGLRPLRRPRSRSPSSRPTRCSAASADNLLPRSARDRSISPVPGTPAVSVVMVLRDRFPQTLMALGSLRGELSRRHRTDPGRLRDRPTRHGGSAVTCVAPCVLRFDSRYRPSRALQRGAATAPPRMRCCSSDNAAGTGAGRDRRGAAAAALRSAHRRGRRQGGSARMAGCRQAAASSGATVPRWAICAMPRRWRRKPISCATSISARARSCWCAPDLLRELDGFDDEFVAAGRYADADLCVRIAEAGSARGVRSRRRGHAMESAARSATTPRTGPMRSRRFFRKHANLLRFRYMRRIAASRCSRARPRYGTRAYCSSTTRFRCACSARASCARTTSSR